jgi:hypothetical protein
MVSPDRTTLNTMIGLLDQKATAGSWRTLLEVLQPTGVADSLQIQETLQLPRDKVRRLIEQMRACSAGQPDIIKSTRQSTKRASVRGRAPSIYKLDQSGAGILRLLGHHGTRACRLKTELEIQHAVLMLDIRLAARKAGLPVITDRDIPYGEKRSIRPDNAITLAEGTQLLYETEQGASSSNMRRITTSLSNKLDFFNSPASANVSKVVRMIVNVAPGKEWERTIKVWEQVAQIVAQGKLLPYRLLAMPHTAFLENPDWDKKPDPNRWIDLSPLPASEEKQSQPIVQVPQKLLRQSMEEDRLVLAAMWQQFLENGQPVQDAAPRPNPAFFETMRLIHNASFNPKADALSQAAMPWASIYLLNHYLRIHPALKKQLAQSISRAAQSMRWNTNNILHRVQVVVDRFLAYHGWGNRGGMFAFASTYDYINEDNVGFYIEVKIRDKKLLTHSHLAIPPSSEEVKAAEDALEWVLLALFAYADRLNLPTCGFW